MALEPDNNHVAIAGLETERSRHLHKSFPVRQGCSVELFSWEKVSTPQTGGQQHRRDADDSLPVLCRLGFVADQDVVVHGVRDVVHREDQAGSVFDAGETRSRPRHHAAQAVFSVKACYIRCLLKLANPS